MEMLGLQFDAAAIERTVARVKAQKEQKRDFIYPASALKYTDDGKLHMTATKSFKVGDRNFLEWAEAEQHADLTHEKIVPEDGLPEGWLRVRPDLAVEIVSPNDLAQEINARVVGYLSVGVPLVWVLDPSTRLAQVYRQGGSAAWSIQTGELSGELVLPGFTCRVEELFADL